MITIHDGHCSITKRIICCLIAFHDSVTNLITLSPWLAMVTIFPSVGHVCFYRNIVNKNIKKTLMLVVVMDGREIQVFNVLIHTFAKMLTVSEVQRVKRELRGHIRQESLDPVKTGRTLMALLTDYGFLNENKLMFFKKILNNSHLHEAEDILGEYVARRKNIDANDPVSCNVENGKFTTLLLGFHGRFPQLREISTI